MISPALSFTATKRGILVDGLHSRGLTVFNASTIELGVPAKVILTVLFVVVIAWRAFPVASTVPVPFEALNVLMLN